MQQNEGTYDEALLLIMHRYGYPEETYYTFSYSPVPNDEGGTGGILCANTDDTQRMIGERRLALLRELAAGAGEARTVRDAFALSARALATGSRDLPFALLYLHEPERNRMVLAGAAGLPPGHPAALPAVELDAIAPWPLGDVLRTGALQEITDFSQVGTLPAGAWDRPPSRAVALPLSPSGESGRAGVFVAGLNPYRLFDDDYRGFLELVAGQIAGAMVNAQAYEDERERAEALAELDRAKTAFFSNVSHEFRTPLTLLLGPLEEVLVRWDPGAAPGERALIHTAHRNGLRLLKLVNTLLDFARIEAGRARASYHPTDLPSLTAELASSFQSAVERTGLRFEVRCPPLAEPVWVDRDMWEKIVLNLVSNAFKFTFDGGITVELREVDREAVLTVEDTGTGIPAADLPRLFERFHRVEGSRGRTHEGTGIGLALVQELTRLHGGGVTVESEVGRGSQFKVRIPLGTAHLPAEQLESGAPPSATATRAEAYVEEALRWLPASGEGPPAPDPAEIASAAAILPTQNGPRARVVVADDNADMREYVGRLLGEHYDVLLAGNGKEALRLVREEPVDLVLSDVMMPLLDGFGLLRALRDHPDTERLPVILLSARAGEEAKVEGLEARADDYIVKPFAARELLARVSARAAPGARPRGGERGAAGERRALPVTDRGDRAGRVDHGRRRALAVAFAELRAVHRPDLGGVQGRQRSGRPSRRSRSRHGGVGDDPAQRVPRRDPLPLPPGRRCIPPRHQPGRAAPPIRRRHQGVGRHHHRRGGPAPGGGTPSPGGQDGGDRQAGRRPRARLQQSAPGDRGLRRLRGSRPRAQRAGAAGRARDPEGRGADGRHDAAAPRVQPTAGAGGRGARPERRGRGQPVAAPAADREQYRDGGAARPGAEVGAGGPRAAAPGADEPRHQRARRDARRRRAGGAHRHPHLGAGGGRHATAPMPR